MRTIFKWVAVGMTFGSALAGCAKRPDAIVPVDIPIAAYAGRTCPQLATELSGEQTKLTALSKEQNQAATGDAVGVFLVGVPASSVFGADKEGEVAVSKGKVLAIQNAMKSQRCA